MEKIISYPISIVYYVFFALSLLIFHPIQWICFNLFGYQAHKKSVDYLNWCLIACTRLVGTTYTVTGREKLPKNQPVILVANHQSMFDIISIIWFLRDLHPKFVSKIELGKGIPSVSYNLRHGGSVLIDRKDPKQAIPQLAKMGKYIEETKRCAVIFPEGTRSKNGTPKEFAQTGLKVLCKASPSAMVLPVTVNRSWQIVKFGMFPVGLGTRFELIVHEPKAVKELPFEELFKYTEDAVKAAIRN